MIILYADVNEINTSFLESVRFTVVSTNLSEFEGLHGVDIILFTVLPPSGSQKGMT